MIECLLIGYFEILDFIVFRGIVYIVDINCEGLIVIFDIVLDDGWDDVVV